MYACNCTWNWFNEEAACMRWARSNGTGLALAIYYRRLWILIFGLKSVAVKAATAARVPTPLQWWATHWSRPHAVEKMHLCKQEKLPAPNVTSTAGRRLPNASIPNSTPHLRVVMPPVLKTSTVPRCLSKLYYTTDAQCMLHPHISREGASND